MNLAYVGWIGHRNVGDEAIYLANQELFSAHTLIESKFAGDLPTAIIGGGTVLPQALFESSGYCMIDADSIIGVGVGVRQEKFDAQTKSNVINIRKLCKDHGINYNQLPELLKKSVGLITSRMNEGTLPSLSDSLYLTPEDYKTLNKYNFTQLSVRGPDSKRQLAKYGIDSKIIGDPALILEPSTYNNSEGVERIGVVLRGRTEQSWADDLDYIDDILDFLEDKSDTYEIVFLPFSPQDIPLHLKSSRIVDNSTLKDFATHVQVDKVMDEIKNCDIVIGEKLHGNVLSACCYTPFISIEYLPKSEDFTKSLGLSHLNIRNDSVDKETLEQKFEIALSSKTREMLKTRVEEKRRGLREFTSSIELIK